MNIIKRIVTLAYILAFLSSSVMLGTGCGVLYNDDQSTKIMFVIDGYALKNASDNIINSIKYFAELMPCNGSSISTLAFYETPVSIIESTKISNLEDKDKYLAKHFDPPSGQYSNAGDAIRYAVDKLDANDTVILIGTGSADMRELDDQLETWNEAVDDAVNKRISMYSICIDADKQQHSEVIKLMIRMGKDTNAGFFNITNEVELPKIILEMSNMIFNRSADIIAKEENVDNIQLPKSIDFLGYNSEEVTVIVEGNVDVLFIKGEKDRVEFEPTRKNSLEIADRRITILNYSGFNSDELKLDIMDPVQGDPVNVISIVYPISNIESQARGNKTILYIAFAALLLLLLSVFAVINSLKKKRTGASVGGDGAADSSYPPSFTDPDVEPNQEQTQTPTLDSNKTPVETVAQDTDHTPIEASAQNIVQNLAQEHTPAQPSQGDVDNATEQESEKKPKWRDRRREKNAKKSGYIEITCLEFKKKLLMKPGLMIGDFIDDDSKVQAQCLEMVAQSSFTLDKEAVMFKPAYSNKTNGKDGIIKPVIGAKKSEYRFELGNKHEFKIWTPDNRYIANLDIEYSRK